ncbi:MAG: hypothetical protein IJP27_02645 [Clostridia bacterium]|nr:hypothetical protein [Clostridia bacterium]
MDIKKRVRKYKLLHWSVSLAAVGLTIYLMFGLNTAWSPLVAAIAYLVFMHCWRSFLYNKLVGRVLTHDLDPVLFGELHDRIPLYLKSGRERIFAAYFSGDYQTAVNICRMKLQDRRLKKISHLYYSFLARIAFDTGDIGTLREVCDAFEREASERIRDQYQIMKFFHYYLDGDYHAAYALYRGVVQDAKYNNTPFDRVVTRYTFAVACRLCGKEEEAKNNFEYVAQNAGKLHLVGLAEGSMKPRVGVPDPNYRIPGYDKAQARGRLARVTAVVLVVVAAGVFFWVPFNRYHLTKEECNLLFRCIPQDFVQGGYSAAEAVPALDTFAELDKEGNLILRMNLLQQMTLSYPEPPVNPRITAEGNVITVCGFEETVAKDLMEVYYHQTDLLTEQLLAGKDLELYLVLTDGSTGEIYLTTPFPYEFTLDYPFSSIKNEKIQ